MKSALAVVSASLIGIVACRQGQSDAPLLAQRSDALDASLSKIGVHVKGDPSDWSVTTVLNACPKVSKWVIPPSGGIADSMARYKQNCSGGVSILRVWLDPNQWQFNPGTDDPTAKANQYWAAMQPQIAGAGIATWMVDWLEGPNEAENLGWYRYEPYARWYASFWSALADNMNGMGYRPLVGSIGQGNPGTCRWDGFCPSGIFNSLADMMRSKPYLIAWSYHAYSDTDSGNLFGNPSDRDGNLLRYRVIRDETGLGSFPLLLTEAGLDGPSHVGWQLRGVSADLFMSWIRWLEGYLDRDASVIGATLFTVGNRSDPEFYSYDISPISNSLADYLRNGPRYFPAQFFGQSTQRGFGRYGDWDFCREKADCATGETVVGISVNPDPKYGRVALCRTGAFSGDLRAVLGNDVGDNRRAYRLGDWDSGYFKLECGAYEYVVGVSQNALQCYGDVRFHAVACAYSPYIPNGGLGNNCYTRGSWASDDRATTASGDWDWSALKFECGGNQYVAGVSTDLDTGAPHKIICCSM